MPEDAQRSLFAATTHVEPYVREGAPVVGHLRLVHRVHRPVQLQLLPGVPAPDPVQVKRRPRPEPKPGAQHGLTILRLGLGRDSIAMLVLLAEGKLVVEGKALGPKDVDAAVFSDTGTEWPHTYGMIPRVAEFAKKHGIRFIVLSKPPDEAWRTHLAQRQPGVPLTATPSWRAATAPDTIEARAASGYYHARAPLLEDYNSKCSLVRFKDGSCTENHKIGPNRALMEDLAQARFGKGNASWSAAVRRGDAHPHRVLIGFAADEKSRADDAGAVAGPEYEQDFYPLIEAGIAKKDEQAILQRAGFGDVIKSGCFMCKFQPLGWYWALHELYPGLFERVVSYEDKARAKNPKMLIFPKDAPIREAVAKWRQRNPTATVGEVLAKDYLRPCEKGGCEQEAA